MKISKLKKLKKKILQIQKLENKFWKEHEKLDEKQIAKLSSKYEIWKEIWKLEKNLNNFTITY